MKLTAKKLAGEDRTPSVEFFLEEMSGKVELYADVSSTAARGKKKRYRVGVLAISEVDGTVLFERDGNLPSDIFHTNAGYISAPYALRTVVERRASG